MLNIFQYRNGLQIIQVSSITQDEMGELQVLTSDGKLYYHNGTISSAIVTEDGANTISNTNLVDNSTFIIDNSDGTIRIGFNAAGTTGTTTTLTSSQTTNRVITIPDATDTLVGKATTDILTNKSISGLTNTFSNIANASLSNMAAHTFKANNTASPAVPSDITGTQATAELDPFVGGVVSGTSLANDISGFIVDTNVSAAATTDFLSQSFLTTSGGAANTVTLSLYKSGSPTGNITIEIQSNSAGDPSGTVLASTTYDVSTLPTNYPTLNPTVFTFSSPATLLTATLYHIVIKGTGVTFGGGGYLAGASSTNTYPSGTAKKSLNSGGTWSTQINVDFYFDVQSTTSSAGLKGLVPAPASGDAVSKFLKADGTWATVVSGGGGVVSDTGAATLSNKNLVDNSTFIIDNTDGSIRIGFNAAGTTGTTTTLTSSQTTNRIITFPDATDTLVGKSTTDILNNKFIETSTFKFEQVVGTRLMAIDLSAQASATQLNLASLISSSQTVSIPDSPGGYSLVGTTVTQQITNKDIDGGTASNTHRITLPKDTKTNLDGLTRKQATIVYASDQNKAYVDNGVSLIPVGSGSGGGVNFIILDSTFQPTQSDSVDAENTVGNWAAYADAAGTSPVDMTGGSPVVTIARTTTVGEVLNGSGSFKVVKDAANRQGNGVSTVAYIPLGYRGQRAAISLPFKVISGSLVQNDLKLYAYDVTNSQVLTPEHNDVIFTGGLKAVFDIPLTCSQIRFGFHFASTSTTAVTFSFDDVSVGPQSIATSDVMSDWVNTLSYTPAAGFGTVTATDYRSRRVGDSLQANLIWTNGTTSAASGTSFLLPTGFIIDAAKLSATVAGGNAGPVKVGTWVRKTGVATPITSNTNGGGPVYYDGDDFNKLYLAFRTSAPNFIEENVDNLTATGDGISIEFTIPIAGWSSNTAIANSGIIRISDILANGTRVTGTPPTQLGEYRSYLRNGSARTFTETNGSPATPPTSENGIVLYQGNSFTVADTNNNPTRYEIFVGKNKCLRWQFATTAGRTGAMNVDMIYDTSVTTNIGYGTVYDPVTGIASVFVGTYQSSYTQHFVGLKTTDGDLVSGSAFFDIFVADNDFQIQLAQERSEIYVTTPGAGAAGYGTTNDRIRRYTVTQKTLGSAITYSDSSTDGALFTINETGIYTITIIDFGTGSSQQGVSVNSPNLTTAISDGSNDAYRLLVFGVSGATNLIGSGSVTTTLQVGDKLRPHVDSATQINGTQSFISFRVIKVSN